MNFQFVFLGIGLLTILSTLVSLRREHIRTEYSVSWLLVGILLTVLAGFPWLLGRLAGRVGIGPGGFFLMTGGVLISALVFELTRVVSRLTDQNTMMAQRIAILEFQIRETNKHVTQDT
jgi:hypothetical protein